MFDHRFVIKHTFENVTEMKADERTYSEEVVHYGIPWSVAIEKKDDHLTILLHCHRSMSSEQKWSVTYQADSKIVLGSKRLAGAHWYTLSNRPENHYSCSSYPMFIKWGEMLNNYVKDGCLNVEVHVSSLKMKGIERVPLRSFDKATSKEYSDTTLIVKGQKFYVSKLFLSTQSSHFKHLLMEEETNSPTFTEASSLAQRLVNKTNHARTQFMDQFKQPGRTVITLEDVDPDDFQVFLEVLYGEPAVDDDTVNQLLKLARMYNADSVIRRCEEFLIEKSAKRAGLKFDIALNFGLESLKVWYIWELKHCIEKFKSAKDVRAAIPLDLSRIDRPLLEEMFKKNLTF
ncbi:unnamed protein product [Caenorhabditis brenneri]